MHNMIIESEREELVIDDQPLDHHEPLVQHNHVPTEFRAFLAMTQVIRDAMVHTQLQNVLVEHLWERRGNVA
jgi:hypothetical protein